MKPDPFRRRLRHWLLALALLLLLAGAAIGGSALRAEATSNSATQPATAPAQKEVSAPMPFAPVRTQAWLLTNPAPRVIPIEKSNPVAVVDKFAARARSIDERMRLRAYDGAPPVIPHPIAGINLQTCRACHAEGLKAGDKQARMVSHTFLINCTQCHVEAASPMLGKEPGPDNAFVGRRPSGYGGTRAWTGAPPVMPHTTFMRTNCTSCHGEFGYDGWRPDHLARTNCIQCHAPAAEFDQLSPAFGVPDVPDGLQAP